MSKVKNITWLPAVLTVALLAIYCFLVFVHPLTQDEGVFLTIGKQISTGAVPHQDFFDHKPPAIHLLFAGIFFVFGLNLWAVKIFLILCLVMLLYVMKKIGDQVYPGSGWLASCLTVFLFIQFEGYFLIAEPFMVTALAVALFIVLTKKTQTALFFGGLFLGLAALFKQTALLSIVPLAIFAWSQKKLTLPLVGGLFSLPILAAVYLMGFQALDDAWQQAVVLTLTQYPRESLGYVVSLLKYSFLYTLPVWAMLFVRPVKLVANHQILLALVVVPLPALFFRHYPHYWMQIIPFVALLSAAAIVQVNYKIRLAVLAFCLCMASGKVMYDGPRNVVALHEQQQAVQLVSNQYAPSVLAENQFTAMYYYLPHTPLNKYLYLTEITDAEYAEAQTISDLKQQGLVLVLWPIDVRFAYAKNLQKYVLANSQEIARYEKIGLRVLLYRTTSQ